MKKCFIMFVVFVLMLFLAVLVEDTDEVVDDSIVVSTESFIKKKVNQRELPE